MDDLLLKNCFPKLCLVYQTIFIRLPTSTVPPCLTKKAQDSFQGLPDSDPAHDEPYFAEGDFGSEGSNAQRFQQLLENFGLNSTIDLMILGYHPSQNAGHAWGLPGDGFGALTSCEMISDLLRKRHHWKS